MANQNLPVLQRQETAKEGSTPDFQGAFQNLAESQNNLSAIGAKVAQTASNTMAQQLGYETGKKPQGDLFPSVTEFDKNFADSYHAQANATLTLQGQKLLDDTQVEMSKFPRLSAAQIEKANQQLVMGLKKISDLAPSAIKGNLEAQFASSILDQNKRYTEKMIGEQKQDESDNLKNAIDIHHKNILEYSKNGDEKGANAAIEAVKKLAANGHANRFLDQQQKRVAVETAEQLKINGKYINGVTEAIKQNRLPEFEKELSKGPPKGMSNEQWMTGARAAYDQANFINSLRAQAQNLEVAQFNTMLALGAKNITPSQIQHTLDNVSPVAGEELHLAYLKKMMAEDKAQAGVDRIIQNPLDPKVMSAASAEDKNKAYEAFVSNRMLQGEKQGNPISRDDAEVEVASSMAGAIPHFTNSINEKMSSQNPNMIESAGRQMEAIQERGAGQALRGVTKEAKAVYGKYKALRNAMDPNKAAQIAHDTVFNQDDTMQKANEAKWTQRLKKIPTGQAHDIFALKLVGLNPAKMLNPSVYGNDILQEYKEYFTMLNGDDVTAQQLVKESVKQNYGESMINGTPQTVFHPIEKVLNLPENAVSMVQLDVYDQIESKLVNNKKDYDEGKINEYWELTPRANLNDMIKQKQHLSSPMLNLHPELKTKADLNLKTQSGVSPEMNLDTAIKMNLDIQHGSPIEIRKHHRGGKVEKYNVVLQMSPFASRSDDADHPIIGGWNIGVTSKETGLRPFIREAPYVALGSYNPDVKKIKSNYLKLHPLKG